MGENPLITKIPNSTIGRNSSIYFKVRDIVKYREGSKSIYGHVKRCCLVNDIPCLGIEIINDITKDQKQEYYLREELATSVTDIATVTEYVENFMILPSSIITTEDENNENWKLNQSVKVRSSGDPSYFYEGKIRWTGKINSFKAAAVMLNGCDDIFTGALNNGVILGRKLFEDETGKTGFFTLPSLRKVILRTSSTLVGKLTSQPQRATSWINEWNERSNHKVKEESNFQTPTERQNLNQEMKTESTNKRTENTINENKMNMLQMKHASNIVNDQEVSNLPVPKKESPTKQPPPTMYRSKRYTSPFIPKVKEEIKLDSKENEQEEIQLLMDKTGNDSRNQTTKSDRRENENKMEIVNELAKANKENTGTTHVRQAEHKTVPIDVIKPIILEMMKVLLIHKGDLTKSVTASDLVVSLFSVIHDRKYFQSFMRYSNKLDLLSGAHWRELIMKMVLEKRHDIISILLNKCIFNDYTIEFLLTLAVKALKINQTDSFKIILEKCPNRSIIMENGETLLTHLLKSKENGVIVKAIIESGYFDLNARNKMQETALVVACQTFNIEVVKLLLQLGCDATQAILLMNSQTPTAENTNISNGIKYLLGNFTKLKILDVAHVLDPTNPQNEDTSDEEEEKKIILLIRLLWTHCADLVKTTKNQENILSLAYNLVDKSYFEYLLENVHGPLRIFSNEVCMKLLMKLSSEKNWKDLSTLLDLSVIEKTSDIDLLNLAMEVLKKPDMKLYEKIIDKCADVNVLMTGGETFLTNLFKQNIKEEIIKAVIKSKIFDTKTSNSKNETILMLACSKLMKNIVEMLLQEGCDISHAGYAAVRLTVMAGRSCRFKVTERKKTEILNLFFCRKNKEPVENQIFEDYDDVSSTISHVERYTIPHQTIIGDKTGVQCWSKTNFLESIIISLFVKSDNLDFLIHPMIEENECGKRTKRFRDIIAWKIVYVLREFGYVSSDRIEELMETYEEVDEIDDLITFFSNKWPNESLLSLTSHDNVIYDCMSLKLFVELNQSLDYITCQELLDISMTQNKMMFTKIPGCLILEAVRDSKSVSSYKYIIPSRSIEISPLHTKSFKKCCICNNGAEWQCSACLTENGMSISNGLLCNSHKCHHPNKWNLMPSETQSHSKVSLKLQSVLCKLNERYFPIINGKEKDNEWLLFQSLKLVDAENSDALKVTIDKEISAFLNMGEKEQKATIIRASSDKFQRLMVESCIFIYKNDSISCY